MAVMMTAGFLADSFYLYMPPAEVRSRSNSTTIRSKGSKSKETWIAVEVKRLQLFV